MAQFIHLIKKKKNFILSVYGFLMFQAILTFGVILALRNHPILSNVNYNMFILFLI